MSQQKTSRLNRISIGGGASELTPFTFARHSVACERHPDRNEDSIFTDEQSGLAAVFDGVGGSAAGEIASQTAARSTRKSWKRFLQQVQKGRRVQGFLEECSEVDLCNILEQLIIEADEQVRTEGAERAGTSDLATTVAIAALIRNIVTSACVVALPRLWVVRSRHLFILTRSLSTRVTAFYSVQMASTTI